jgi:hypothetical protein
MGISKQAGQTFKADELPHRGSVGSLTADGSAGTGGSGGGVSKPIPVAFPWTIYTVPAGSDDEPGLYCLAIIDIPKDTKRLSAAYSYVKKNGAYGRRLHSDDYKVSEAQRTAGRVEWEFGPIRPNARLDIVRLIAERSGKDAKNPDDGDPDRRGPGATPAYSPPAIPASPPGPWIAPYANQIPGDGNPLVMATILTSDYITGSPRIEAVGAPTTGEEEGLYYPVTVACTENPDLLISLRFGVWKIGKRQGSPAKVDLTQYGSRIMLPRHELTEEERETLRTTGQVTVMVGPVKGKKAYDIRWVRARFSLNPDDAGARVVRKRHPVAAISGGVDTNLAADPADTTPVNSLNRLNVVIPVPGAAVAFPTGAAMLARLDYNSAIVHAPSAPATGAGFIPVNAPNDDTRRDGDSITHLRIYAHPTDTTVRFIDSNLQELVAVTSRWPDRNTPGLWRHDRITLETPATDPGPGNQEGTWFATYVDVPVKGQRGTPMCWVKNVGKNLADRIVSAVTKVRYEAGSGYGDTDAETKITARTCSAVTDAETNKETDVTVGYTNHATEPAIPRRIMIYRSKGDLGAAPTFDASVPDIGNATWKRVADLKGLRNDPSWSLPGAQTHLVDVPGAPVKRKYYVWRMYVVGSATPVHSAVSAQVTGGNTEGVPPPPNAALGTDVSFKRADVGSGKLSVLCAKPADNRPFTRFDFAFNTQSNGLGNWINPHTGASLGTGSLPAGGTDYDTRIFEGSGKRWESRLRRQELKTVLGTLPNHNATAFYVFARIIDTADGSTERYGGWNATGSAVTYRAAGLDPDGALPPRHYAHGTKNIIINGGFLFSREESGAGAGAPFNVNLAKHWFTDIDNTPMRIDTTVTNTDAYWDKGNHRLLFNRGANTGAFTYEWAAVYMKRHVQPGEALTLSLLLKKNINASGSVTVEAEILDMDTGATPWTAGTIIWSDSITVLDSELSTSAYNLFKLFDTVASSYTVPANRRLVFRIRIAVSPALNNAIWYMDNLMLVRGNQVLTWEMSSEEEDWGGDTGSTATAESRADTGAGDIDVDAGGGNDGVTRGGIVL